jgi:WD40 repeat protein
VHTEYLHPLEIVDPVKNLNSLQIQRTYATCICSLGDGRIVVGWKNFSQYSSSGEYIRTIGSTLTIWNPATREYQMLEGHTSNGANSTVLDVCVLESAQGLRIVSGSQDNTLRVWDAATGVCLRVLEGHTEDVTSVCAFDSTGVQRIVSGSDDNTLRVWDIVKEYPKVLKIHTGYLYPNIVYAPLAGKPDSLLPANTFLSESNSHLYLDRDISKIERWDITNLDSFPASPPSLSKQFTSLFTTSKTPSSAKIAPAGGTRRVKKRTKRKTRARSSSRRAART